MPIIRYVGPAESWVPAPALPVDEQSAPLLVRLPWGFQGRFQQQPGGQPDLPSSIDDGAFQPRPMQVPRVPVRPVWLALEDDLPPASSTAIIDEDARYAVPQTRGLETVTYLWLGDDTPPFLIDEDHPAPRAIVWPRYQIPILYRQGDDDLPPQPNPLEEDSFVRLPPPVGYAVPLQGFRADDVLGFVTTLMVEDDQYVPRVMQLPDPSAAIRAIGKEGWEWLRQAVGALGYRFTVLAQLNYRLDILPGGVTMPGTLYIASDNLLRIRDLQNLATGGSYENAATVSAVIADVTGAAVGGAVGMPYVGGTNGWYEGTLSDATAGLLTEYGEYLVTTTVICPDGLEVVVKRRCIARYKA